LIAAMRARNRRLIIIGVAGVMLVGAATLAGFAMRDTVIFFYGPTEALERGVAAAGERARIGGLVEPDTVIRGENNFISFGVTDGTSTIRVGYTGHVPDLFREGQGVVVEGTIAPDGTFQADRVLARHDENYMPREVVDILKEQGEWRSEGGA
jgi:cytochrome c-type biogenesis protein CcmE